MKRNFKVGILLIGLGVFLLLAQMGIFSGSLFLAFLGIGFLVVYVLMGGRKNYGNLGFLIPGFVLLALAAFSSGDVGRYPSLFFLFLSLAFWGVLILHTVWFTGEDWGTRMWPLFPGAGLLLFSGFIYAVTELDWTPGSLRLLNYLAPLILIGVGVFILLKKGSGK